MSGFIAPFGYGDPRVAAIPQPWDPQPFTPYQYRPGFDEPVSIDPGVYALPQPGWYGDPGMVVPQDEYWAGDPGIVAPPTWQESTQPPGIEAPHAPTTDAIAALDAGDHVEHGAKSMVIPGILGGVLTGMIASSAAPAGLKGATFVGRGVVSTIGGIATGAGMGLAVAGSSPQDGDSLQARYALAGGVIGAASGAVFSSPATRGISVGVGAVANGALGWFIGRGMERRVEGEDHSETAPDTGGVTTSA